MSTEIDLTVPPFLDQSLTRAQRDEAARDLPRPAIQHDAHVTAHRTAILPAAEPGIPLSRLEPAPVDLRGNGDMPWCERCQCYHHDTADHISAPAPAPFPQAVSVAELPDVPRDQRARPGIGLLARLAASVTREATTPRERVEAARAAGLDFAAHPNPSLAVPCPKCGAIVGEHCDAVSLHHERLECGDAAWEAAKLPAVLRVAPGQYRYDLEPEEEPMKTAGPKETAQKNLREAKLERGDAKTKKEARARKDAEKAIASATSFIVSHFEGGAHASKPCKTFDDACQTAGIMEDGATRRSLIYAVQGDGRSVPIPRNLIPASKQEKPMLTEVRTLNCATPRNAPPLTGPGKPEPAPEPAAAPKAPTKKPAATKPAPAKKSAPAAKPAPTKKAAAPKKAAAAKPAPKAKAATKKAPAGEGPRPGSKLEIIYKMLTRSAGCTTKQVLEACDWPAVSMPQQARALGIKLKKEKVDGVTVYRAG